MEKSPRSKKTNIIDFTGKLAEKNSIGLKKINRRKINALLNNLKYGKGMVWEHSLVALREQGQETIRETLSDQVYEWYLTLCLPDPEDPDCLAATHKEYLNAIRGMGAYAAIMGTLDFDVEEALEMIADNEQETDEVRELAKEALIKINKAESIHPQEEKTEQEDLNNSLKRVEGGLA